MFLKACSNMGGLGGPEVGMEVAAEGGGVLGAEVGLDAAKGGFHHGEAAEGRGGGGRTFGFCHAVE